MQMTLKKMVKPVCDHCHQNAEARHKKISERAYQIFLEEGRPEGRMDANWYEAELELMLVQEHCHPMPCGCGCSTTSEHAK